MEDRILRLETEVVDLKVQLATATTELRTTNKQLEQLLDVVTELRDVANKSKGALWVIVGVAGTVGALATTVLKKVFGIV